VNFLRKKLFWISFILLLFYSLSIFYRSDSSFDQDLGRHLRLGEIIVNTLEVPKINLFSYTNPDFPFINHHFLFGVILYIWSIFFSLQSFLYIKILILLTAVSLTLLNFRKTNSFLFMPLGYLFLHVLRERTDLRPEIFSFLFTALTLFILEKFYTNKSKLIFFLPLIQLFWVNFHIYFFLGFVLQGIYLIDLFISKEFQKFKNLLWVLGISIYASLFNPNGISGFFYPLSVFGNYGYTIAENQNIFLLESINFVDHNFLFVKVCAIFIIISCFITLLKNPFSIKNNLIVVLGLGMALINIRSFPYLFFISFPFVLTTFKKINKTVYALIIVSSVLLIFESLMYLSGEYYKKIDAPIKSGLVLEENAKSAMNFILDKNLPQPIYNNFDIGSYIIYRSYPRFKVFVDGRPESYPADFFTKVYIPSQSDYATFKDLENYYKFQTTIFSITDQTPWGRNFLKNILSDKDWSTIYLDDFIIVLIKNKELQNPRLTSINLENLSPEKYNFSNYFSYLRLSYFLYNCGYFQSSKTFSEKALSMYPDSRIANSLMFYFESLENKGNSDYFLKSENNLWW
jgi:hypothetical protein